MSRNKYLLRSEVRVDSADQMTSIHIAGGGEGKGGCIKRSAIFGIVGTNTYTVLLLNISV